MNTERTLNIFKWVALSISFVLVCCVIIMSITTSNCYCQRQLKKGQVWKVAIAPTNPFESTEYQIDTIIDIKDGWVKYKNTAEHCCKCRSITYYGTLIKE